MHSSPAFSFFTPNLEIIVILVIWKVFLDNIIKKKKNSYEEIRRHRVAFPTLHSALWKKIFLNKFYCHRNLHYLKRICRKSNLKISKIRERHTFVGMLFLPTSLLTIWWKYLVISFEILDYIFFLFLSLLFCIYRIVNYNRLQEFL